MPDTQGNITDLEKQVDSLLKQIDDVIKTNDEASKEVKKAEADDSKDESKDDSVEKRIEKAAEMIGLEPDDLVKLLTKAWPPKAKDGKDSEDDSDEDDTSKTKKAAASDDDETVEIEGQSISKAAVGEAVFNVMKAQSEKIEKQRLDIAKAQEEAEMERLRKLADDKYRHVPGTTEERAQILKSVTAMPKGVRESLEKVLQQSEKLAKSAFDSLGNSGGREASEMRKSAADFEKKVAEIAQRDKCSQMDAMAKARQEDPEAFRAFQGN